MSRAESEGNRRDLDSLLARPTPEPQAELDDGGAAAVDRRGAAERRGGRIRSWLDGGDGSRPGVDGPELRPPNDGYDGVGQGVKSGGAGGDGVLRSIPVASIEPNGYQPRRRFDEEGMSALAESIGELGVLQPVLVRPSGDDRFELIAGERRWRAARRAGLRMVPAIVRVTEDQGALEQAIVENLHREDLNVLEEAAAYQQLVDDFGLTQDEVARRVGKSRSAIGNTLRLFHLEAPVQRMVADGLLSAGHARALLGVEDGRQQVLLAKQVVQEELSVRQTERAVREAGSPRSDPVVDSERREAPVTGTRSAAALEIERLLEDRLETRVEVQEVGEGGRIVIRFADGEDLSRIFGLL